MNAIQTSRLTLRNCHPDDWRDLHEMIVQYRASEWAQYDDKWPTSAEEIQGVTRWFADGDSYLAVCLQATGKLIGCVALNRVEREGGAAPNLGYVFNFDYHNQGYATQAARAAVARAFEQMGATRIVTGTAAANLPSCRVLAKLGFRGIGNGEYELTRGEWLAQCRAMACVTAPASPSLR
jgi:RimJ/RimL family protein N-acetyltransferase